MVYMGSKDRNSKRNAPKERYNNLIRQRYSLLKVKLFNKDIFEIDYSKFPKNSLLYFDPPYSNTTKYHNEVDSEKFWELVDKLSKDFIPLKRTLVTSVMRWIFKYNNYWQIK